METLTGVGEPYLPAGGQRRVILRTLSESEQGIERRDQATDLGPGAGKASRRHQHESPGRVSSAHRLRQQRTEVTHVLGHDGAALGRHPGQVDAIGAAAKARALGDRHDIVSEIA